MAGANGWRASFFKIHIGKTTSQVKKFEIAQFCIFSQYFHLTIQGPVVQWVKDNAIHRKQKKRLIAGYGVRFAPAPKLFG